MAAFVDDRGTPQFCRSLQRPSSETGQSGLKASDARVHQKIRHAHFSVRTACRLIVCRRRQLDLSTALDYV